MAVNVIGVPVHKAAEGEIVTAAGAAPTTVIVNVLLSAGFPVAQAALDVSSQVTISPFTNVDVINGLPNATLIALTFHWYTGAPPAFVGVAVKVTGTPEHIVKVGVEILTLTGKPGLTVTVFVHTLAQPFRVMLSVTI